MRNIEAIEAALRDARRELGRLTPYSREWLAIRNLVELLEQRRAQLGAALIEA